MWGKIAQDRGSQETWSLVGGDVDVSLLHLPLLAERKIVFMVTIERLDIIAFSRDLTQFV